MLKFSLFYYSDANMFVKCIISVTDTTAAGASTSNNNKKVIFKNCPLVTD